MPKDRYFYFRVKPAEEALMFERVDVEAEGLYSKMRRDAFRGEPRGFLVDFRGVPVPAEDLADGYRMTNGRLKARMRELHERQIIQTAAEFEASLRTVASAWASKKVLLFLDILKSVKGDPSEVYVIPALLDDVLDAAVGSQSGRDGWELDESSGRMKRKKQSSGQSAPVAATPIGGANSLPNGQGQLLNSNSQNQEQLPNQELRASERERASSARAGVMAGERPMTIRAYATQGFKIAQWTARQPAQSEESFGIAFEAEFQMTWPMWSEIKRLMELSIPVPCKDGHHVFEGNYCKYCPYVSVGEAIPQAGGRG